MSDFTDQYKNPLWQKRRLEMLERANYRCSCCQDDESQLHVHHGQYFTGRKLWEYADKELQVLCGTCHEEAHKHLERIKEIVSTVPADGLTELVALLAGYLDNANTRAGGFVGDGVNTEAYLADPMTWEAGRVAAASADLKTIFDVQDAAENLKNATAMRTHSDGNATHSRGAMPGVFA
jgi:hypothetical protein